jgi:hypothetical protein
VAEDNGATHIIIAHTGKLMSNVRYIALKKICLVLETIAMFCAFASATNRAAHITKSLPFPIHRDIAASLWVYAISQLIMLLLLLLRVLFLQLSNNIFHRHFVWNFHPIVFDLFFEAEMSLPFESNLTGI